MGLTATDRHLHHARVAEAEAHGRYVGGDCCGAEKVRRILKRIDVSRYDVVYAYGDSIEDREMLELAHRKFYRWTEISSYNDVTAYGHPSAHSGARR